MIRPSLSHPLRAAHSVIFALLALAAGAGCGPADGGVAGGGDCGSCPVGQQCVAGQCQAPKPPPPTSCDACGLGQVCSDQVCVACTPDTATPLDDINYDKDVELPAGCYVAHNLVRIENGATMTMDPGVTVFFATGTRLEVDAESGLHAAGTDANPILLTGTQQVRGHWDGVQFQSDLPANLLDHVVVEYAGSDDRATGEGSATVMLADSAAASITHSTLRESNGYGLFLFKDAELPAFDGNTLTRNALGPASAGADGVDQLTPGSSYTGNDDDEVTITSVSYQGNTVSHDETWPSLGVPYLLAFSRTFVDSRLTLAAGVTARFQQNGSLEISSSGALTAIGTSAAPIQLLGTQDVPGWWAGVTVNSSSSPDNQFDYVTIADAGNGSYNSYDYQADLALGYTGGAPVRFSAKHSTFRTSAGWGIAVGSSHALNADIDTSNQFTDDALGSIEYAN